MSSFHAQIAPFMDILVQTALAEMRKVLDESCGVLALRLEKSRRRNGNESLKADVSLTELREPLQSLFEPWMAQFSSMIGVLAQELVNKIYSLVTKDPQTLHLGVTQKQNENKTVKRKLHLMEQRTAGRYREVEQRKKCVSSQTATVTVEDGIRQVKQETGCYDDIRQREDVESLQSVALMDKFQGMKDVIESIIIKEEGLQECSENCGLQEGLHVSSGGLNQHLVQDCEEECSSSAGDKETKGTQRKCAESNLDIKKTHRFKPFKNIKRFAVMHLSDEDYVLPQKKWTPQPDADVRRHGAVHLPEMVDDTHASRCRRVGCSSKTYVRCTRCKVFLCVSKKANCFMKYHLE